MNIENIHVKADGSVHCRSRFYSAFDHLDGDANYIFTTGVNKLVGEIDGGNWAVSYYLSMHNYRPKDFVLFTKTEVSVNGKMIPLQNEAQQKDTERELSTNGDTFDEEDISILEKEKRICEEAATKLYANGLFDFKAEDTIHIDDVPL